MTQNHKTLAATEAISRNKFMPVHRELVERLSQQAERLAAKTLNQLPAEAKAEPEYAA